MGASISRPPISSRYFHRSLEAATTTRVLRAIFADAKHFAVHDPLPAAPQLSDEGAANFTRFAASARRARRRALRLWPRRVRRAAPAPQKYPARQTREASAALARRHGIDSAYSVFAQQLPAAIDAGVFHNDVIAVGHGTLLFCHQQAWVEQDAVLAELGAKLGPAFAPVVVPADAVPLADAVATYLFNAQLLPRAEGGYLLVAPAECRETRALPRTSTRSSQAAVRSSRS